MEKTAKQRCERRLPRHRGVHLSRTLEYHEGEKVDVGDSSELLRQVLLAGEPVNRVPHIREKSAKHTLGTNESRVYLLVLTLLRS